MDARLVERHLSHIATHVELLRRHGKPDQITTDPVQFGFVVHTLQTAIQAAIDVAAIVVSERHLGEPETNREMFVKLAGDGWLETADADLWSHIVSFRNIVVHRYLQVDAKVVRGIVDDHLQDLLRFVTAVRARLATV